MFRWRESVQRLCRIRCQNIHAEIGIACLSELSFIHRMRMYYLGG